MPLFANTAEHTVREEEGRWRTLENHPLPLTACLRPGRRVNVLCREAQTILSFPTYTNHRLQLSWVFPRSPPSLATIHTQPMPRRHQNQVPSPPQRVPFHGLGRISRSFLPLICFKHSLTLSSIVFLTEWTMTLYCPHDFLWYCCCRYLQILDITGGNYRV